MPLNKKSVGLVCLCFWLQFNLQNLYVACTYADHVARRSTFIMGVALATVAVVLAVLTALSTRVNHVAVRKASFALLAVSFALFLLQAFSAAEYSYPFAIALAGGAGAFTAVMVVQWGFALRGGSALDTLRSLLTANLLALAVLFVLFDWLGQIIWLDIHDPVHMAVLRVVVVASAAGACLLCPVVADEGPLYMAQKDGARRTAWKNLLLGQGKLLAGVLLFCFCATLHWEINAMRNGNGFDISWEFLGHEVGATYMSLCYLMLAAAVIVLGLVLIEALGQRIHLRTLITVLFYTIGAVFFVPGLFGIEAVSSAGFTMVGMFLYCACAFALLLRNRSALEVSVSALASVFFLVAAVGLGLGLLSSWALAPHVSGSDPFCIAFTALSLFFVMTVPSFLFGTATPSSSATQEAGEDPIVARCRELALARALSPREMEIMELAARGYSAPAIASTLYISENTVKVHMRHIYEKLGVHTKQELIRLAQA